MRLFRLQTLTMPGLGYATDMKLYARLTSPTTTCFMRTGAIAFGLGDSVSFDTFFNAFTVDTWRREARIDDLSLVLRGRGKFMLRFGVLRLAAQHLWLDEVEIDLQPGVETVIPLAFWPELQLGLLFFQLTARSADAQFEGGYFGTATPPLRQVKLGLVITHFKRKNWVLPAIRRIRDDLLADPDYRDRVELVIVDNSQDITREEAAGVTLLPNRNLGGSGGFCRGLMYLEDQKTFTHCLFMDDDASCEIESIRRAYALMSYAVHPKAAVAGSLLRELEPYCTHEVGAIFDGGYHALKNGLDAREVDALLELERPEPGVNYGGWWFFGFALDGFEHYPYPFFVRGDDVLFSLQNKFHIITMNGVACWGEDFWYKESPNTRYLWARATLVLLMTTQDKPFRYYQRTMSRWFKDVAYSYHYDSAHIFSLAIRNVLQGPGFFTKNLDMTAVRAEIAPFAKVEKLEPITRSGRIAYPREKKVTGLRNLLRKATFNGHLMPGLFIKKKLMFQPKGYGADLMEIYKFAGVHYEHEPLKTGFVLRMDRKRFFVELFAFRRAVRDFREAFDALRDEYRRTLPEMTSRAYWEHIFAPDDSTPAAPAKDTRPESTCASSS